MTRSTNGAPPIKVDIPSTSPILTQPGARTLLRVLLAADPDAVVEVEAEDPS